ncbi:acyl-CoA dehydrogenase family protein [Rhizobium sp. C4]|uniref:acyl-CoA dehydrogenase family protein n=1 Tax=Rhizobium sp. C4 TaxID=1349800 RepID=UPI001E31A800|nr:acyl-CoA dehydrogenase family protein [Rhizobium sp. C4]MCD2172554.1 acyl-CoA/acyl-ACP dehydrogenase [Rhizobium sp. C4]
MPQMVMDDEDGELAMLRDSVAAFAENRPGPKTVRALRGDHRDMDTAQWTEMAEAGWLGLMLPEELGGAGLGIRHQAIISEALGRALIPSPMTTASVLSSLLLAAAPDSAERSRLAEGLIAGSAIVVPAIEANGHLVRLNGRREGNVIRLDGHIEFVEAAHSATDFIVLAEVDGKTLLLSLPSDCTGLSRADKEGVEGTPLSILVLEGCRVAPEKCLIDGADAKTVAKAIDLARVAASAELSGIASRAFEMAREYTVNRVQFGKPIASFQVIQHRLVDLWSEAEMAAAAVVNAIEFLEGEDEKASRLAVLAAKARASDAASLIARRAIHLYGAMGFTDESDIGLYLKRAINLGGMLGQAEQLRRQFVIEERAA